MSRGRWMGLATAVLLLAAAFRLVLLRDVPPGLSQDEVFNAGMVPFILEGNHALFFREAFGHEPLYHYWTIPFQLLLGDHWLAARLPAVVLGLLLVALLLAWARREFGEGVALMAAAFVAVSWWPVVFSRIGLRPIMLPVFLLLFAWFWPKRPLWAGVWLGLSLYTYTAARVVFLIPALMFVWGLLVEPQASGRMDWKAVWAWVRSEVWKPRLRDAEYGTRNTAVWVLIISLLIYAPLGITLWLDPSLQTRVSDLSGPLDALRMGEWGPILETTRLTLGVFTFAGDPRWTYTLPGRPLFEWGTAVIFWLGFGIALWRWQENRFGLVLVWLSVGLIPSAVTPDAPSTVRMVGAIPPTYLLVSLGLTAVWEFITQTALLSPSAPGGPSGIYHIEAQDEEDEDDPLVPYWLSGESPYFQTVPLLFYTVALILLFVFWNGWRTVRDGFIEWPRTAEGRDKYQTIWQEVGDDWAERGGSLVVADAFFEQLDDDTLRRDLGSDPQARWQQTGGLVFPREGNGRLYLPEYAPLPLELEKVVSLKFLDRSFRSPHFTVYALPEEMPPLEQKMDASFGETLRLMGYQLLPPDEERPLRLLTQWEILQPLPADLSLFVHLVEDEAIVAQHDGLDVVGTTLQSGDRFFQLHELPTDAFQPDAQTLWLGVYRRESATRLLLSDGGDRLRLPR